MKTESLDDFFLKCIQDFPKTDASSIPFMYIRKDGTNMECKLMREVLPGIRDSQWPLTVKHLSLMFNEYINDDFKDESCASVHFLPMNGPAPVLPDHIDPKTCPWGVWVRYKFYFNRYKYPVYSFSDKKEKAAQDKNESKIFDVICSSGNEGISLSELSPKTQGMDAKKRKEKLKELLDLKLIYSEEVKKEGSNKVTTLFFRSKNETEPAVENGNS